MQAGEQTSDNTTAIHSMITYVLLVSRQGTLVAQVSGVHDIGSIAIFSRLTGKVRLAKWFQTLPPKQKAKIVKDVTQLVLARRTRMCNFLEYKGTYLHSCCCRSLTLM